MQDAKTDVHYTIYYPLTEKYQSLYPRQGEDTGGGGENPPARKLVAEKPAMWKVVERCSAEGTLEALREGKLLTTGIIPASEEATRESKNRRRRGAGSENPSKRAVTQDEEEKSDGGFFEELT